MQPQDVFNQAFDKATDEIDAWLQTMATVAAVDLERTAGYWRARLAPRGHNACPVELMLSRRQVYDIDIGGESLVAQPLEDVTLFLPLLQAIAAGHVVKRDWLARATGTTLTREKFVHLSDGRRWSLRRVVMAGTAATETSALARDHTYLGYSRS